jgi:hypothetical protein
MLSTAARPNRTISVYEASAQATANPKTQRSPTRMKTVARELLYALLAWFIPFVVSVCTFPLKQASRPLFESLMAVTIAMTATLLGLVYLRRAGAVSIPRAAGIGITWTAANWLLDLFMFSGGPMKMPVEQYATEIAAAYLVIPVITVGLASAAALGRSGAGEQHSA